MLLIAENVVMLYTKITRICYNLANLWYRQSVFFSETVYMSL